MLRRIRIQNYKSLRDVNVELQPLSVLFGHNAGGKSNFVDALQLLPRVASSRSLTEAFEPSSRGNPLELLPIGPGGIEQLLGQDAASFRIEADVELSRDTVARVEREIRELRQAGERDQGRYRTEARKRQYVRELFLRYAIEVEVIPRSGVLRLRDESLAALRQDGELKRSRNPFLERVKGKLHLRLETPSHPMQFEVGIDHAIISRPLYAPHYPHLLATKYELRSWRFFDLEPRGPMREASGVKEARDIGPMGEDLAAFLNTLQATNPEQFRAVETGLRQIMPRATEFRLAINKLGEVELAVVEGDSSAPIPSRLVSEGTLRVIGLLAAVSSLDHPGLIGLEGPEAGIHPRQIQLVAEYLMTRARIGTTQLVVTTRSPVLLEQIPSERLYVVRRIEGATRISRLTPWGSLATAPQIRENLSDPLEVEPLSARQPHGDLDDQ